jgi:hypothetical protein
MARNMCSFLTTLFSGILLLPDQCMIRKLKSVTSFFNLLYSFRLRRGGIWQG